jgi:hypothetical protein
MLIAYYLHVYSNKQAASDLWHRESGWTVALENLGMDRE